MIVIRGWSVHVPGIDPAGLGLAADQALPPERAHELLGRKGLLYKDEATRLALCAVHRALGRGQGEPRPAGPVDPATAVVVSSNLGNVAVVRDIAATVRAGSGRDVSPMLAPGASSNVIATAIAIWFRFGGPNLMICSGATGGLDAVGAAMLLLRARRAERVIVVGVEPADQVAAELHENRAGRAAGRPLRAAAACVVLDRLAGAGPESGQASGSASGSASCPVLGAVGAFDPVADPVAGPVIGPAACAGPGAVVLDHRDRIGDTFGAAGVLGVAVAAALTGERPAWTVTDGDELAGWRRARVEVAR